MESIRKILHLTEQGFDKLSYALRKRRGYHRDIYLVVYHGYGNNQTARIQGRVLKNPGILPVTKEDSIFKNIERAYKHFASIELPDMEVAVQFDHQTHTTTSGEEGYFKFELPFLLPKNHDSLWHQIQLKLSSAHEENAFQTGYIQVPLPDTRFGIISDIDDTILQTGATSMLKMIKNTFTQNAKTRLSFPGVNALYRGLQQGTSENPINPIFYLSNGPWNLFDFLDDFMELNDIPKGSILLRDWGLDNDKIVFDSGHKLYMMRHLLETYPELPFILMGDSGEKDPEYYRQIVTSYPGRILAVYIRNVTSGKRNLEVRQITEEVTALGVPMLLMHDTLHASEHAASMGWILPDVVEKVRESVKYN